MLSWLKMVPFSGIAATILWGSTKRLLCLWPLFPSVMRKLESVCCGTSLACRLFCLTEDFRETCVWCLLAQFPGFEFAFDSCHGPGALLWKPGCPRTAGRAVSQANFKAVGVWSGLFRVPGPSFHVLPFYNPSSCLVLSQGVDCPHSRWRWR